MNNTAVRAKAQTALVQSTTSHKESVACSDYPYDKTHMVFESRKHEEFYYEKLSQARVSLRAKLAQKKAEFAGNEQQQARDKEKKNQRGDRVQ